MAELSRRSIAEDDIADLMSDLFPVAPDEVGSGADNVEWIGNAEDVEVDELHRLQLRREHGSRHAWTQTSPQWRSLVQSTQTSPTPRGSASTQQRVESTCNSPAQQHAQSLQDDNVRLLDQLRIPRENDAVNLQQMLHVKDIFIRQMQSTLLPPAAEHAETVNLSRRAQGLVANARRREAMFALSHKALTLEVEQFRARERKAVHINAALRRRLREVLTDHDAIALRREVRTLRADLGAALAREAALQKELMRASFRIEADEAAMSRQMSSERRMREDLEYVRAVAVHAMSTSAANALGDPPGAPSLGPVRRPAPPGGRICEY